jgi:predicted lipoprotein with Yx(FWY)xxD motif
MNSIKRLLSLPILVLGLGLIAAACGSDGESTTTAVAEQTQESSTSTPSEPETTPAPTTTAEKEKKKPKPGTTIKTADSPFGEVLFDGDGQAIYLFDLESSSKSECYGECAVAWPPVLTKGVPQAKGAVKAGKLGTTKRDDGKLQVTYDGHPLYYYAHEGPDVVSCHNVDQFGGLWLALGASGNPV